MNRDAGELSHDELLDLYNNAPCGFHSLDGEGRFVRINDTELSWLGYSREEVVGKKKITDVTTPRGLKIFRKEWPGFLERGWVKNLEFELARKDGSVMPVLVNSTVVKDESGGVVMTRSSMIDVTNRKRAEEATRSLASIIESTEDAVIGKTLDGTITSWNKSAEKIYGYSPEEVVGRPVSILVPPDLPEDVAHILARIRQGKGLKAHKSTRLTKDGRRISVSLTISPVMDDEGHVVGASTITRDITLQEALEEERDRLFNLSLDMLCVAGFDGYFKQLNPAWERTTGWSEEELSSKPYLEFVHPEDRDPTIAAAGGLSEGRKTIEFENRYLCKDGSYKWLSWNSFPLVEEELIFAIARDITDRKEAEQALEKLNTGLRQRTIDLEAANRELEAFSYSVSHDLRAPLRGIDGFSQALLEEYRDRLDEEGRHYLERVRAASQQMAQLIDDLLKLSRVVRAEMHSESVDLSQVAQEVCEELSRAEPGRRVEFDVTQGLKVEADPRLLRIAVRNLLDNAWKFTGRQATARVEVGATDGKRGKAYFVRDDGAGFEMEYAGKLFGAFQRLHSTDEFPGTGIGLATVQRIVHRHGGRVWAEGRVGKGATFYFTLGAGAGGDAGSNEASHRAREGGSSEPDREGHPAGRGQPG